MQVSDPRFGAVPVFANSETREPWLGAGAAGGST